MCCWFSGFVSRKIESSWNQHDTCTCVYFMSWSSMENFLELFLWKKKVETNVKSHLNQLILTIVTINQFRLLLNINIALYFTCIGAICLFYVWGINIYLIFFFSIANFMKMCQICLNWMFISLKKNDGIGSLFERSDAFQCCMFSSTLSSLVILVHLVKNLILW